MVIEPMTGLTVAAAAGQDDGPPTHRPGRHVFERELVRIIDIHKAERAPVDLTCPRIGDP
jgi:hypothetical protein